VVWLFVQQFDVEFRCLGAVVPRHQFIIDSNTVRIFFSKCHIQLPEYTSFLPLFCPNTSTPFPVYGLFLRGISKNDCQTGNFRQVFIMAFAKRLKLTQTYRVVYGHSLLYNTLLRKFVSPCLGPFTESSIDSHCWAWVVRLWSSFLSAGIASNFNRLSLMYVKSIWLKRVLVKVRVGWRIHEQNRMSSYK
jgi:hypothetical protein